MGFLRKTRKKKIKPVSFSALEHYRIDILPQYLNPQGLFFGGALLQIVEKYAQKVAQNHAQYPCIVQGIDFVRFFSTVKRGDALYCYAQVNRCWDSLMEIGVKIVADDFLTLEKKKILNAYFSFVAVDEEKKPVSIYCVKPETKEQITRYLAAEKRRMWRLKNTDFTSTVVPK